MALSRAEVEHIARLARVGLTPAEIERLQSQLSSILAHFASLQTLDTSDVPPTAHTLPLTNVERADEPRPSYPIETILANAPQRDGDFIRVRRVLE